jgi:signal peptidase I
MIEQREGYLMMKHPKIIAIIIVCLLFVLTAPVFALSLMNVKGSSMLPTARDGQKIWIIPYHSDSPKRGDVIAFRLQGIVRLKRIVGIPGDTVVIRKGLVHIVNKWNPKGYILAEPYLAKGTITPKGKSFVPKGHYFVLGDNRQHSQDSLNFGPIPQSSIIGKARDLIFLSLDKKNKKSQK